MIKTNDVIRTVKTVDKAVNFHEREDATSYNFSEMIRSEGGIERLSDLLNISIDKAREIAISRGGNV